MPPLLLPPSAAPPPPPCDSPSAEQWFIYAMLGVGGATVATQLAGLLGNRAACCLTLFTTLQLLSLLTQGAFVAAVLAKEPWATRLPCPGEAQHIEKFLSDNGRVARAAVGALFGLEALTLALACCVRREDARRRRERSGSYDWDSDLSDEEGGRRRPLLSERGSSGRSTPASRSARPSPFASPYKQTPGRSPGPRSPSRMANDAWSQRMRDKYGLDTSNYSYQPREEPPGRAMEAPVGEGARGGSGGCAVM